MKMKLKRFNLIIAHTFLLLILGLLYVLGFQMVKYLAGLYFLIVFFEPLVSAYYILFILFIMPFLVYTGESAFTESFAQGVYIFIIGGVLSYIVRNEKVLSKFFPFFSKKYIYVISGFFYFTCVILSACADRYK